MINFYDFYNRIDLDNDELYRDELVQILTLWHPKVLLLNVEHIIKRDPHQAYRYARNVLRGRWPDAEPFILTDIGWTFYYMTDIINMNRKIDEKSIRWSEGEDVIIKDPDYARQYAEEVLERRWIKAEKYIKTDPDTYNEYCRFFKFGKYQYLKRM